MLVLGLSGSPFRECDPLTLPPTWWHDAAAVLVRDGRVIAAAEEERFNRIKHSNRFPELAISACLGEAEAGLADLDRIVCCGDENHTRSAAIRALLMNGKVREDDDPAVLFRESFRRAFDIDMRGRLDFVNHHVAHAVSAHRMSGWSDCLVVTMDGRGDRESGLVISVTDDTWETLEQFPISKSLGLFYERMIDFIGFSSFEEYKVMSLAAYGDPSVYRELFWSLYRLLPDGRFDIPMRWDEEAVLLHFRPRRRSDPITRRDMDFAASLQEALEDIVFHMLHHYRRQTGHRNLAMAGGVALNCALSGKLMVSEIFENIFVQPASNDAGCALGAALHPWHCETAGETGPAQGHSYLGPSLLASGEIAKEIRRWEPAITCRRLGDAAREGASLLVDGALIGWAQGRMEFGPRALGNRSILADARNADNVRRINAVIKKRNAFQPFAPAVVEERLHDYFEVPDSVQALPFMTITARVRPPYRDQLAAITHVDGTARVQTVSRDTNPRFWSLLDAIGALSGLPVVLNTSFNNQAEPIVNSVADALNCFLSTDLDHLVIDDFLVSKRDGFGEEDLSGCIVTIPDYVQLLSRIDGRAGGRVHSQHEIVSRHDPARSTTISEDAYAALAICRASEHDMTIGEVAGPAAVMKEILELWNGRFVRLQPASDRR